MFESLPVFGHFSIPVTALFFGLAVHRRRRLWLSTIPWQRGLLQPHICFGTTQRSPTASWLRLPWSSFSRVGRAWHCVIIVWACFSFHTHKVALLLAYVVWKCLVERRELMLCRDVILSVHEERVSKVRTEVQPRFPSCESGHYHVGGYKQVVEESILEAPTATVAQAVVDVHPTCLHVIGSGIVTSRSLIM